MRTIRCTLADIPDGNKVAEISIPSLSIGGTVSSYDTRDCSPAVRRCLGGKFGEGLHLRTPCPLQLSGLLVVGSTLVFAPRHTYDAGTPPSQTTSDFTHSLNLSTAGHNGPYRVGGTYPGWVDSYMGTIPSTWQAKLRGAYFTGGCCSAIASIQSNGPGGLCVRTSDATRHNSPHCRRRALSGTLCRTGWAAEVELKIAAFRTVQRKSMGPLSLQEPVAFYFLGRQGVGPFCYGAGDTATASAGRYHSARHHPVSPIVMTPREWTARVPMRTRTSTKFGRMMQTTC